MGILRNKYFRIGAILFVVFMLWTRPAMAGNLAQDAVGKVFTAGDRLSTFVNALTK
jgi:hypothetical protein